MKGTAAVLWTLYGTLNPGSVEVHRDRLELCAHRRTLAIPFDAVAALAIERGPATRINGLPALRLSLVTGDVVRVASLEGAGVLHELAALLAPGACSALRGGRDTRRHGRAAVR